LDKLQIPKTSEELEEKSEEERRMMKNSDLNELAFAELILSIDVSNSSGKIEFGILKSCKTKDYEDGNATHTWEKLKKKFDPVSAPTLVKTWRMIRESKLGRNEDPEIWINNLEDL
jgi:thermostable 8-oxoguanine DNA glycosylase